MSEDPHMDDEGFVAKKQLKDYEQGVGKKTGFFSTYSPDLIEEVFLAKLKELGFEKNLNVKDDKYKIKFDVPSIKKRLVAEGGKEEEDVEHITNMQMEMLLVDKKTLAVEFQLLKGGDRQMFVDHYTKIMEALNTFKDSMGPTEGLEKQLGELEVK